MFTPINISNNAENIHHFAIIDWLLASCTDLVYRYLDTNVEAEHGPVLIDLKASQGASCIRPRRSWIPGIIVFIMLSFVAQR